MEEKFKTYTFNVGLFLDIYEPVPFKLCTMKIKLPKSMVYISFSDLYSRLAVRQEEEVTFTFAQGHRVVGKSELLHCFA